MTNPWYRRGHTILIDYHGIMIRDKYAGHGSRPETWPAVGNIVAAGSSNRTTVESTPTGHRVHPKSPCYRGLRQGEGQWGKDNHRLKTKNYTRVIILFVMSGMRPTETGATPIPLWNRCIICEKVIFPCQNSITEICDNSVLCLPILLFHTLLF